MLEEERCKLHSVLHPHPLCVDVRVSCCHAGALATRMSDMLRRKSADLAAAQQIFIKTRLVAGDSGCQSCVMQ